MPSNQLSSAPAITGTPTAHRNGLVRAQAETIISQPTVGSAQTMYTGSMPSSANGEVYSSGSASTPNRLTPAVAATMHRIARPMMPVATAIAIVISGAARRAIATFDSTVSWSETGSDFQNSTLLSLRSSNSEPRQKKNTEMVITRNIGE